MSAKQTWSPKTAAEKMRKIIDQYPDMIDREDRHSDMDDLLCDILEANGFKQVVKLFKATEKFYG